MTNKNYLYQVVHEKQAITPGFEIGYSLFKEFALSNEIWSLATYSAKDHDISSRSMSLFFYEGKFYFQTDSQFEKCRHLEENPEVALSIKHYSIKGVAKIIGHPLKDNYELWQIYREHFPNAYRLYSHLDVNCVIEITPTLVKTWEYHDGIPYQTELDIIKETYKITPYL